VTWITGAGGRSAVWRPLSAVPPPGEHAAVAFPQPFDKRYWADFGATSAVEEVTVLQVALSPAAELAAASSDGMHGKAEKRCPSGPPLGQSSDRPLVSTAAARWRRPLLFTAAGLSTAIPISFLYHNILTMLGVDGITSAAVLVVFASALVSSIAGFAFSAICGAVLLHLVPSPVAAVQIMLVCSIGIQSLSVWMLRQEIEWRMLSRLLAGGLLGLPVGVWLLLHLSPGNYAGALGGLLVLYGAWTLLRGPKVSYRLPVGTALVFGFAGGITGGMAALPGPFVTIWSSLRGEGKARQRGLTQPFILAMQICTLAALLALGRAGGSPGSIDLSTWAYLPWALAGTRTGLAVFRILSDKQFTIAVNLLLIVSGLGLLL
jgi:uncharacterized membrane protein YfcA